MNSVLIKYVSSLLLLGLMTACSQPNGLSDIHDPFEAHNRQVHAFNKQLDQSVLRPIGQATKTLPDGVKIPISNFANNAGLPKSVVNNILQADLEGAITNIFRFGLNTTLGIAGLFDPATSLGIYEKEADFGQTLAGWGVSEGAYLEIIGIGPSTERDAAGIVVDFVLDPLGRFGTAKQVQYGLAAKAADLVIARGQFSGSIDSVLYESADSYAQSRLFYLQNRRFELGVDAENSYFDPYYDPYSDPYEN